MKGVLGVLEASWRRLGGALGASWGVLGPSWRRLGGIPAPSSASEARLGGVSEAPWGRLGGEDREKAPEGQLKAQKYPFYLDSVTSTLKKHRKTRGGPEKI